MSGVAPVMNVNLPFHSFVEVFLGSKLAGKVTIVNTTQLSKYPGSTPLVHRQDRAEVSGYEKAVVPDPVEQARRFLFSSRRFRRPLSSSRRSGILPETNVFGVTSSMKCTVGSPSRLCKIAVFSEPLGATHIAHTGGCSTSRWAATQAQIILTASISGLT